MKTPRFTGMPQHVAKTTTKNLETTENMAWLTPGPTWYHLKLPLILGIFGSLIPKLYSDQSESGEKEIIGC